MKNKIKPIKPKFEMGQEVFVIQQDLEIVPKKIVGFKQDGRELKYELDVRFCQGISEKELSKTKRKAEIKKKNFLDDLKFRIGDLVVFEYEDYTKKKKTIGRITNIVYSGTPYEVKGAYKTLENVSDEEILLKIKNEFIENYENLQELYEQFEEKEKEINDLLHTIFRTHDELEKELETSIRKQYGLFNWNKSKPKFEDRFSYEDEIDCD